MSLTKGILIGTGLLAFGLVIIPAASAAFYAHAVGSTTVLEFVTYSSFIVLILGIAVIAKSILNVSGSSREDLQGVAVASWRKALWLITRDRSSMNLRLASTLAYGLFLSIISGTLVIQPGQSFSAISKVAIPSTAFAVCCGPIGQMPQLVAYLLDDVGLVITPLALVLLLVVSWLVGLNANAAVLAYRIRSGNRDSTLTSTIGSFLGLFSICPACAQGLLGAILGASGAVFVTMLASYQSLIVGASIPLLAVSLGWTVRNLSRSLVSTCDVPMQGPPRPVPSC